MKLTLRRWDDDEFVICKDGKPWGNDTYTKLSGEKMIKILEHRYKMFGRI